MKDSKPKIEEPKKNDSSFEVIDEHNLSTQSDVSSISSDNESEIESDSEERKTDKKKKKVRHNRSFLISNKT